LIKRFGGEESGWPFAAAVRAGDRVFVGGLFPDLLPATGFSFHSDPLQTQSESVLTKLDDTLASAGAGLGDVVRLGQWFTGVWDWPEGSEWSGATITRYMEARAARFPDGVPASIAVAARRLPSADALVGLDALAVVGGDPEVIERPAPEGEERSPFPAGARASGWAHLSGELPTDWRGSGGSAVAEGARVDGDLWYGHPARAQADFVLRRLARTAKAAGTDLSRAVRATVFLADRRDYVGFEEAWCSWFPEGAPARTVVPGAGLAGRGCRVEVALDLVLPGSPRPEPISPEGMAPVPGHEAAAVRVGDLLFLSGQMAVGGEGADTRGLRSGRHPDLCSPPAAQLGMLLERIGRVCAAAGTGLENLIEVRLFFSHLPDFGAALHVWRDAFGDDPPTGTALGVGALLVPGCVVMADAVAYVPDRGGRR